MNSNSIPNTNKVDCCYCMVQYCSVLEIRPATFSGMFIKDSDTYIEMNSYFLVVFDLQDNSCFSGHLENGRQKCSLRPHRLN